MDFRPTDEQRAARDLARDILADAAPPAAGWIDTDTWGALAGAGLVGLPLGEDVGGGGLDWLAAHHVLLEVGRSAAPVPYWETIALAGRAVDEHGPEQLRRDLLPGVVAGETLLTAALLDEDSPAGPGSPEASAERDGAWRVSGVKTLVPLGAQADALLVTARRPDGRPLLGLLDPDAEGVAVTDQQTVSDVPHARVELAGAPVPDGAVLGDGAGDPAVLTDVLRHGRAGLCALQAGMCAAAVRLAADHTSEREQFGRPLATFQAVSQRVADAHIEAEGVRLTALEAAWRLASGHDAADAVDIAAWWAAEAGHRVLHAVQHVHGGVGVDRDYPLHRYFLRTRQNLLALGGADDRLAAVGARMAAEPHA